MSSDFDHGGRVFAIARQLGVAPEDILDFSASINPLGLAPGVRSALTAALDRLGHYPDNGCSELREALAGHHGCDPGNVCVGNGSTELIYLLPRLAVARQALLVAPTFSEYEKALRREGWGCDYHLLQSSEGFPLSLPELRRDLVKGYGLMFLCNPGNPTGRLYGREEVGRLLDLCGEAGTLLVVDEAFMDFSEEDSVKHAVIASGRGVVLRSMTKFFAFPGLRLGYALAAPPVASELCRHRQPWSVNSLAQAAGVAALSDTGYAVHTRLYIESERAFLTDRLGALPGMKVYPAAANYLLVEMTDGLTASVLQERLLTERLLIRNCAVFLGLGNRFFRVAVRTREENERLLAALASAIV